MKSNTRNYIWNMMIVVTTLGILITAAVMLNKPRVETFVGMGLSSPECGYQCNIVPQYAGDYTCIMFNDHDGRHLCHQACVTPQDCLMDCERGVECIKHKAVSDFGVCMCL